MRHVKNVETAEGYARDGYRSPVRVLSEEEAAEYRAHFEAHARRLKGHFGKRYLHKTHLFLHWMDALVHHPEVLRAVTGILGEDVQCWTTNLFVKEGGDPAFVSWHQDSGYWNLEPPQVVTAWIALSPSTVESGCLQIIPGSHLGQLHVHEDRFEPENQLTRGQAIVDLDESKAVALELSPGEMSLHHIHLAHASKPNLSDSARIGVAIRYVSTRVAPVGRRESAMLVAGVDDYGHFLPERRPQDVSPREAQMAHNRALRLQVPNNYVPSSSASWRERLRLMCIATASKLVLDVFYLRLVWGRFMAFKEPTLTDEPYSSATEPQRLTKRP